MPFTISLSELFLLLSCGSTIFLITCHCFSVESSKLHIWDNCLWYYADSRIPVPGFRHPLSHRQPECRFVGCRLSNATCNPQPGCVPVLNLCFHHPTGPCTTQLYIVYYFFSIFFSHFKWTAICHHLGENIVSWIWRFIRVFINFVAAKVVYRPPLRQSL